MRFTPVSARETPWYTEELVARTHGAFAADTTHPLLVVAAFALDLLCIHPFADGNGRITRLLSAHLLDRHQYGVGRVRDFVLLHGPSTFRIGDIRAAVPGVSDNTIRLVLADLKRARRIHNDGTGRNATWRRLR